MKFDVVRQPLLAAFLTLLAFAAIAAMHAGRAGIPIGPPIEAPSILGDTVTLWQAAHPSLARVLGAFLLFYAGILLGRATVRYALYAVHTYLTIPLFGILAATFTADGTFLVGCLACMLLILSMCNYYASFRNGAYAFDRIFRASLYLGVLPLLYTPALLLGLVVPVAFVVFKRSAREQLVAIAGYLLPLVAWSYLSWAAGHGFTDAARQLWTAFLAPTGYSVPDLAPATMAAYLTTLFLVGCSALCYYLDLYAAGSKSRSILLFNLVLFGLTVAMGCLPSASGTAAMLMIVPAATLLPLLWVRLSRSAATALYAGILVLSLLRLLW